MLKIVFDPKYESRWLINNDGIEEDTYYGAVEWRAIFNVDNTIKPYVPLLEQLVKVIEKTNSLTRLDRDVIRALTLEEYQVLNKAFQFLSLKYNKKTNKLCSD